MERYRVLVVEDDAIVAADTMYRLKKLGHDVVTWVSDGAAAIAAVRETSPDVILMDIGLPGTLDGIATAAQCRELSDVPVIYLTAHEDDATLARAKVAEPYGYLLKPSTDRELQITIELAVYRHTAERERTRLQGEVKRLEGIVPICAACKKMRTDAGYWQRVEEYLSQHTEARFSHTVCPECMPILYPDFWKSDEPKGNP